MIIGRRHTMFGVLALGLMTLPACGDNGGSESESGEGAASPFERSAATTVADFTLVDFAFKGPSEVKGPKVFFTARNEGTDNHELEILDNSGDAVGEIEAFAPGVTPEGLAAVLTPGKYTLQCILTTDEGKVHKDLGMTTTLTVT